MKCFYKKLIVLNLTVLIIFIQPIANMFENGYTIFGQKNQTCRDNLDRAEEAYYDEDYYSALESVKNCLKQPDITKEQRIFAYTILARTFLALDKVDKSKEYIAKIFELNPGYSPTIEEETPKYVNLTTLVREQNIQKKQTIKDSGFNSWYWIGAGAVITTAAIIFIAGSNDDKKDNSRKALPEPPDFP